MDNHENGLTDAEKVQILLDVSTDLKHFTMPYITGIYGIQDDDHGELLGSGTFIEIKNKVFILTARHVILSKSRYKAIAHSIGHGMKPVIIKGSFFLSDSLQDIALAEVDKNHSKNVNALKIEKLASSSSDVDKDILFLHGFYQAGSRFSGLANGVVSDSFPYGSVVGNYSYDWVDEKKHFAFDYPTNNVQNELGRILNLSDPHGLSGSGVWLSNRASCGSLWNTDEARLVGVAINWDQAGKSLIITRIESVLDLIATRSRTGCLGFLMKLFY